MIYYQGNNQGVILQALDEIPLLRDGKGDVDALVSFHSDIKVHRKFMRSYQLCDTKIEKIELIEQWNKFMKLRNEEDFVTHFDSKNKLLYASLF